MNTSTINYLLEIRKRMLHTLVFLLLIFTPLFFYANDLFLLLAKPLLGLINGPMIAINITAPLLVPIELALKVSLLITLPFFLYQLWSFIAPALYPHEHKIWLKLYSMSLILFGLGLLFCYFIVLPLLFGFFTNITLAQVKLMPDIAYYLNLTSQFFFLFGLSFQIPVIIYALCRAGVLHRAQLITMRPYFIVASFTIGMLLTPPDVLSQLLLAIPICLLYEFSIWIVRPIKEKQL